MSGNRGARWEAKQLGKTRYFTGKPCSRGHVAERQAVNGMCMTCGYDAWKRNIAGTPKRKAYEAARVRDPGKLRPIKKAWKQRNQHLVRADAMRRHVAKLRACPYWADHSAIDAIYAECVRISRETGIRHHVDHIVPLRGRNVCGLHVAWNLRVIPASENLRKNNDLFPELVYTDCGPMPPRQPDLFWRIAA